MSRQGPRPVRLNWEEGTTPAQIPARLVRQTIVLPTGGGPPQGRLIHGDNLAVMTALLPEFEGRVDLVYIDPPFHSGKAYPARVGTGEDSRRPEAWRTSAAYDDRWPDLAAYLEFLRPRLDLIHRLLARTGSLVVHLDWHTSAYVRILLDEIFGSDRFLNEVVWVYHGPSPIRSAFSRKHDTLLVYTKSSKYVFNAEAVRVPYDPATWKAFASSSKAGFGKVPNLKRGKVPEDWWFFPVVARLHGERTGYPTQKPLALLDRVVRAWTRPGALVADFFCGSGTALVAASRLGRRWIGCDSARLAYATCYHRLLLDCPETGFEAWAEKSAAARNLEPHLRVTFSGGVIEARLRSRRRFRWLEADWNYDGKTFRSRSRLARPWRSDAEIPPLRHPIARKGEPRVAFRTADSSGVIYRSEISRRVG